MKKYLIYTKIAFLVENDVQHVSSTRPAGQENHALAVCGGGILRQFSSAEIQTALVGKEPVVLIIEYGVCVRFFASVCL